MNTHSVPGLSAAVKHYTSDKLKERSQGLEEIRDIFDSRDNVAKFHETAAREGGSGWLAFYQCLFQVVSIEKKAALKKGASAQADRRLSEAIGLVRRIAERTFHYLSKKPFVALFTHLVTLLVYGRQIFPPAAIDYIKALRTLLSYPPHLESLDQTNWKILAGVCWASLLGDPVRLGDEIDEDVDQDHDNSDSDVKPAVATQGGSGGSRQKTLSTINSEIAGLLPILFSSFAAPLLPCVPDKDAIHVAEPSIGMNVLHKICRFFQQYPNDNNAHLPVLQSLNLVLAQMELNSRDEVISSSVKLVPLLASLWSTRKKDVREQVLIALRIVLPFATHKSITEHDKKSTIREALSKIYEYLLKEGHLRWGCQPIDLSVIKLKVISRKGKEKEDLGPFTFTTLSAGFDFSHEYAVTWTTLELYADICYHLYDTSHSTQALTPSTQSGNKRRRVDNALSTLIANLDAGTTSSRLLHIQVLIPLVEKYYLGIHSEAQRELRRALLDLLDSDNASVQSWALVALGHLSCQEKAFRDLQQRSGLDDVDDDNDQYSIDSKRLEADWDRLWAHATRKIAMPPLSRAACHTATCLLASGMAKTPRHFSDIRSILTNIEIQGPAFPYDSVCNFLVAAVSIARDDAIMYQLGLEDKVMSWITKWPVVDGSRGKHRLDQQSASDVYRLLCETTRIAPLTLADIEANEVLPDCPIVGRVLDEVNTRPLRRLILEAHFPSEAPLDRHSAPDNGSASPATTVDSASSSLQMLTGRPRAAVRFLNQALEAVIKDWTVVEMHSAIQPERARRAIDLCVCSLTYNMTLQCNVLQPDSTCVQSALRLLDLVKTALASGGYGIPAQRLLWTGLKPLASIKCSSAATWPILLEASPDMSGIMKSTFPVEDGQAVGELQSPVETQLQRLLWRDATVGPALRDLSATALATIEGLNDMPASAGSTQYPVTSSTVDDFGDINVAESDTMPESREAVECRITSADLLHVLGRFRVCGPMFASTSCHAVHDSSLINAWLSAEGSRFIQLGQVICDLLRDGLIRLSMDAVDLVLGAFEEMAGSYAYSRNEGLLELILSFLGHSATLWLAPEAASSDVPERVIGMAKFLLVKTVKGQMPSWRVRLAILLFLDEYLDYDPTASVWFKMQDDSEMTIDGADYSPFPFITGALLDIDSRVRLRAATSAAAIFYLSGFPLTSHTELYMQALHRQPGQMAHWDVYMSHLLWKFNCCIASTALRATVMFHLYEIPPTTTAIHQHFQSGMYAVARRLHLTSIADLFRPYAVIICMSQVGSGQKTIMQPFKLYGYSTKSAFASMLLSNVGPCALHDESGYTLFKEACEASSTPVEWAIEQTMPAALALFHAEIVTVDTDTRHVDSAMAKSLSYLPGIRNGKQVQQVIETHIDAMLAQVLVLLDLSSTDADVVSLLRHTGDSATPSAADIFARLFPPDQPVSRHEMAALDSQLPAATILTVNAYCHERYKTLVPAKVAFAAVGLLFKMISRTFLANEELRRLRGLALVIALYPPTYSDPTILQTLMRELVFRIDKTDFPEIVLRMLRWCFENVLPAAREMDQLPEILIQLGEARSRIQSKGARGRTTIAAIDAWLVSQVPPWTMSETFRDSLDIAMVFWPTDVTSLFENWTEPDFSDLSDIADKSRAKSFSSMTLCSSFSRGISQGDTTANVNRFGRHVFWHLKSTLFEDRCTSEGLTGLLNLLAQMDGIVHAPDLATANELGVDPVEAQYKDGLVKDPETMVRTVLVAKVANFTREKEYTLRTTALEVLQRSHTAVGDLIHRAIFPSRGHPTALLNLLVPSQLPVRQSQSSLDVLTQDEIWTKRSNRPDTWASQLAILFCDVLSDDEVFYQAFNALLIASTRVAAELLPWFSLALLSVGSAKRAEVATDRATTLSSYFVKVCQSPLSSESAVQTVIKIVLHLRGFTPHFRKGVMAFNRWLDIDPILLSEAAIRCGAYATALLFLEMLKDKEENNVTLLDPRVQEIMYQIYSNVEDPDGFYGVQTHDIKGALTRRLQHEKLSFRAFGMHGAMFETRGARISKQETLLPMIANLHDMGFDRLASGIYQSNPAEKSQSGEGDPLLLDLAWRTGDWDLPVSDTVAKTSHGSFYACLRSVHRQRDQDSSKVLVDQAVRAEVGRMGQFGLEQMAQIKESAVSLVCLREISLWLDPVTQSALSRADGQDDSLKRLATLSDTMDYSVAERVTATRLSLLRAAHARESKHLLGEMTTSQTEVIVDLQKTLHLHLGRLARDDGKLQASVNAITAVQNLEQGSTPSNEANDEFGRVLWAQKEHALAIQHLEQMTRAIPADQQTSGRLAVLLAQTAYWTSVAKMRAPQEIRATFDKAYNLMKLSKLDASEQARVCHEYALFADGHYQSLSRSPELERLRNNRDRTLSVLQQIESTSKSSKSKSASARTDESRRQDVIEDDKALKELEAELTTFAKMAMKMFATSLTASDEFDDSITRLTSLWLEHDHDEDVNKAFSGPLQVIPTHKFLFLGPQLAARIYKPKQPVQFNTCLNKLVMRMSNDHPFHILYQLITVAQGSDTPNGSTSKSRRASETSMDEGRMPAAIEILAVVQKSDSTIARTAAEQMIRLTNAAVPWCHHQDSDKGSSRYDHQMPKKTPLLGITYMSIPPPSVVPPVDLTRKYGSIATIQRYRTHYRVLGGIHRPKRMTCIDSTGREHYELFKGDDELRQDAVMEQVFGMTNRILSRDRKTKARDLRFRTYAVIPLPNRSGVMEFVGDSQAIGEWLKPAHIKYRAGVDHPPNFMRSELEGIQSRDHTSPELTKRFTEIMAKFKPVMRHYFTEKHREPMAWFSMRLNYVRSVAVTSIVGHILGIGDRHCSNILIDKLTGEMVHIDFGIVFEDGRRLRIPERVPFRLTNDIVDGLGLTGVDGTFRQCSEHTLRVLRESSELILTVLEVFKHDPLYAWAADTEKLKRAQGGGRVEGQSATATEKADRVLSKIRQKLRPDLSVEYTVNQLIQEARDAENLAKIFIGWQPWL